MRVQDNVRAGEIGYVDTPDGKRYEVTGGKRMARLVKATDAIEAMVAASERKEQE